MPTLVSAKHKVELRLMGMSLFLRLFGQRIGQTLTDGVAKNIDDSGLDSVTMTNTGFEELKSWPFYSIFEYHKYCEADVVNKREHDSTRVNYPLFFPCW